MRSSPFNIRQGCWNCEGCEITHCIPAPWLAGENSAHGEQLSWPAAVELPWWTGWVYRLYPYIYYGAILGCGKKNKAKNPQTVPPWMECQNWGIPRLHSIVILAHGKPLMVCMPGMPIHQNVVEMSAHGNLKAGNVWNVTSCGVRNSHSPRMEPFYFKCIL